MRRRCQAYRSRTRRWGISAIPPDLSSRVHRHLPAAFVAFAVALTPVSSASAQTIQGLILESGTSRPINLGEVWMLRESGDTVAAALSDENGFFTLTAPRSGSYLVVARALGYLGRGVGPLELEDDGLMVVELLLELAPVPIEGVDVETTPLVITDDALLANGFYQRMMEGRGQFLTPEDIERSRARYTPQLFRGLDHVRPQYGAVPWRTWVQLWDPIGPGSCGPRVFVDNVWVNKPKFELFLPGWGLTDVVPRNTIRAVELYWGFQAPARYRKPSGFGRSECGVILIWTRTGS